MATINLLPWREEAKQARQKQFNVMAAGSFAAAVLIAVLVTYLIDDAISLQNERNQYIQNEIVLVDQKLKEIEQLRQAKDNLKKRMDLIERLQNTRNLSTHLLDTIASVISPGVYLDSVERKGNSLWVKGLAESNNHLANMLRNIENSQWLTNPLVQHIKIESSAVRQLNSFSLRVDVNTTLNQEE